MLGDFIQVNNNLKTAKRDIVVVLHKLVFETESDRDNRKRLRSFGGFTFDEKEQQYTEKSKVTCMNI